MLGEGVHVRIADLGMDILHEDLKENVVPYFNNDWTKPILPRYRSNRGNVMSPQHHHGDFIAGIIAGRDNDLGFRGVAPRATISMHMDHPWYHSEGNSINAIRTEVELIGVSSHSYGMSAGYAPISLSKRWNQVVDIALERGDNGRGQSLFFTGPIIASYSPEGNGNLSATQTHHGIIPVCATDELGKHFHTAGPGYTAWICAPAPDTSSGKFDLYVVRAGGTLSNAVPVAAGVGALIRSANTTLTWPDVKLILAQSAQLADPDHPEWQTGSPHYMDRTKRYHYNLRYGFGVVDAGAAVEMAQNWTNLPPLKTHTVQHSESFEIPDFNPGQPPTVKETTLTYNDTINFVEYVNVLVDFDHPSTRDLRIELESPSGRVTEILPPIETGQDTSIVGTQRFASAFHLGEDPNGTWKFRLSDEIAGDSGTINSISLVIRGHNTPIPADTPASGSVSIPQTPRVGDTITVDLSQINEPDGIELDSYRYRWQTPQDGTFIPIPRANAQDFRITPQHYGRSLAVQVDFTDLLGNEETFTSNVTHPATADAPNPPEPPVVSITTPTTVSLAWQPPDHDGGMPVESYTIQWKTTDQAWGQALATTTTEPSQLFATVDNLTTDVPYQFRISADNAVGQGPNSTPATATPTDIFPPNLVSVRAYNNIVEITYDEPLDEAGVPSTDQYKVSVDDQPTRILATAIDNATVRITLDKYLARENKVTLEFRSQDPSGTDPLLSDQALNPAPSIDSAPVSNETPEPLFTTAITVGTDEKFVPNLIGYSLLDSDVGDTTTKYFQTDDAPSSRYSFIYILQFADSLHLAVNKRLHDDFVLQIGEHAFPAAHASQNPDARFVNYWWPAPEKIWTHGEQVPLTITQMGITPKPIPEGPNAPPILLVTDLPHQHDTGHFSFNLYFTQPVDTTTHDVENHILRVENATITSVNSQNAGTSWNVQAKPDSTKEVNIHIPLYPDCNVKPNLCSHHDLPTHNAVELTTPGPPMTGTFTNLPQAHDGETSFQLGLLLSEPLGVSGLQPQKSSFTVSKATVHTVQVHPDDEHTWNITLTPTGDEAITIATATHDNCESAGAICTDSAKPLSNPIQATIPGPTADQQEENETNSPATGAPTITGTTQVGETLAVSTSSIADENGLSDATFTYQWLADETHISGATGASYTLTDSEEGKAIKVRVSFTDDAGNDESLTSAPTAEVTAAPEPDLTLADFDPGDGQEVLASALIEVGDRGRKNNENQDRAWYAAETSAWHASGDLLDGSLVWHDMTVNRVVYFPANGVFRFNEDDDIHIGESFKTDGVNRELTIWVQTDTQVVSFRAKNHIKDSGPHWINFQVPEVDQRALNAIAKHDLIIVAVSKPATP